jgi:diguanylate cyclase (GGDEF)-like protein
VPIATRFWFVLAVLVAAMGLMGFLGFSGLANMHASSGALQQAGRHTVRDISVRTRALELRTALQLVIADRGRRNAGARHSAVNRAIVRTDVELTTLHNGASPTSATARYAAAQQQRLATIANNWERRTIEAAGIDALVLSMVHAADRVVARDTSDATVAADRSDDTYVHTNRVMALIFGLTLLLGIGLMVWLIRSVVPRTRGYASFAARVSAGDVAGRLDPQGADELADLGRSLDTMVALHEDETRYQRDQAGFVDALQVSDSEEEAHDLIRRHLERSIAASSVVVLNRNNSDDRLEARTPVAPGSALADGLDGASPRSCLAIRLGRRHDGGGDRDPLLACGVCGKTPDLSACNPLLVGGGVIGSVLINHADPLVERDDLRIRDSVVQAAPVLANLRNLAIAERRAATDALTGLPNNRAVQDTLKRLGAHALRAGTPLGALLLDLDHFKQINDTYGHGRGDEVLAAVAEAMRGAVRDSDFVGRYGGEEFLILLPDTDRDGAQEAAEKLRLAVSSVSLPTVDREITASIGVAVLPQDGSDTDTLVRNADRALYAAKSRGRNRVELTTALSLDAALADVPPTA